MQIVWSQEAKWHGDGRRRDPTDTHHHSPHIWGKAHHGTITATGTTHNETIRFYSTDPVTSHTAREQTGILDLLLELGGEERIPHMFASYRFLATRGSDHFALAPCVTEHSRFWGLALYIDIPCSDWMYPLLYSLFLVHPIWLIHSYMLLDEEGNMTLCHCTCWVNVFTHLHSLGSRHESSTLPHYIFSFFFIMFIPCLSYSFV